LEILFQIEDPENTNVFLNTSILGFGIYSWVSFDDLSVLECIYILYFGAVPDKVLYI